MKEMSITFIIRPRAVVENLFATKVSYCTYKIIDTNLFQRIYVISYAGYYNAHCLRDIMFKEVKITNPMHNIPFQNCIPFTLIWVFVILENEFIFTIAHSKAIKVILLYFSNLNVMQHFAALIEKKIEFMMLTTNWI
jgi:hypothetical protein